MCVYVNDVNHAENSLSSERWRRRRRQARTGGKIHAWKFGCREEVGDLMGVIVIFIGIRGVRGGVGVGGFYGKIWVTELQSRHG